METTPSYYIHGHETIAIIADMVKDRRFDGYEGFLIGNIIKYIERYKEKDGSKDLKKAEHYIKMLRAYQETFEIPNKEDANNG